MTRMLTVRRALVMALTFSFLPGPFWLDKLMSEIRKKRPENIRPKMKREDRAKQFAPFASLGRMDKMLKAGEDNRDVGDPEHEAWLSDLSEEDISRLSAESLEDGPELAES